MSFFLKVENRKVKHVLLGFGTGEREDIKKRYMRVNMVEVLSTHE
jgi:hypothetical protein